MRKRTFIFATMAMMASSAAVAVAPSASAAAGRQLISVGTSSLVAAAQDDGVTISAQEFAAGAEHEAGGQDMPPPRNAPQAKGSRVIPAGGEVKVSFEGLNHRNQRLANGGNQFSLEPPDQGLCAGNGFVLESVNSVLRVFDTSGAALTGVVDVNSFYKYAPAIVRATGVQGPDVIDVTCTFDAGSQRWYHLITTLESDPDRIAEFGVNHLDLAVSTTASPLDPWNIYWFPVQDDGTLGTPDHKCTGADDVGTGPCFGDYPHIGADAYGLFLTTNEYSLLGTRFHGAQIYALSKAQLAAGKAGVDVTQFDTAAEAPTPGFTTWPASAPVGGNDLRRGGTEYLLSGLVSNQAAPPPETKFGSSDRVSVWAVTNTSSLNSSSPSLKLATTTAQVGRYSSPPRMDQKSGNFPLGQCINDTTMPTQFGPGCWQNIFTKEPAHDEVISHLDANDGRMQQVTYFNGKVYGAVDTAVRVGGDVKAGIEWFAIKPQFEDTRLRAETSKSGYVAVAGSNVAYPAIGVSSSGRAIVAFTLSGGDNFPSAAYAEIGTDQDAASVRVIAAGAGPSDGFTSYKAFVGDPPRTRWGDYGATAVVGDTIWVASEYIAQTCTLAQYAAAPLGSCGGTRTALANWSTRVSAIRLPGGRSND